MRGAIATKQSHYTRKARPQCPHKAGKRARTCSQSLVASDYPSRRYVGADSTATRSITVARLRQLHRLRPRSLSPATSVGNKIASARLLSSAVPPSAGLRLLQKPLCCTLVRSTASIRLPSDFGFRSQPSLSGYSANSALSGNPSFFRFLFLPRQAAAIQPVAVFFLRIVLKYKRWSTFHDP